jgi:hypothetical protein
MNACIRDDNILDYMENPVAEAHILEQSFH